MSSDRPTLAQVGEQNIRERYGSLRNLMFRKLDKVRAGPHTTRIVEDKP